MARKIEIITNEEELINKSFSYKKSFFLIIIFILLIIFLFSTTLELKEERAQMLINTLFIVTIVSILLIYLKF